MPTFSEYDLNGDGKILEKEFNEARSKRISERMQQGYRMRNLGNAPSFSDIDTNGDKAIAQKNLLHISSSVASKEHSSYNAGCLIYAAVSRFPVAG